MKARAIAKARRHRLFLMWMNHQERILALEGKSKKGMMPRPIVSAALLAPFCAIVLLLAPAAVVPAQAAPTDDESLLAALNYDPQKDPSKSETTVAVKDAAPAAVTLSSKEGELKVVGKAPAAPAPSKPRALKKLPTPKVVPEKISEELEKAKGKDVTMQGVVGGRSYYGIAVASASAGQSSSEIWFKLVEGVKFQGIKTLMELKEGDTVKVVYKELEESKKRILKSVALLKKAPPEPPEERDDDLKASENV